MLFVKSLAWFIELQRKYVVCTLKYLFRVLKLNGRKEFYTEVLKQELGNIRHGLCEG